jgi:hypothetical protein
MYGRLWLLICRLHPDALAQRILQGYGTMVFLEQVSERFVGEFPERLHGIQR